MIKSTKVVFRRPLDAYNQGDAVTRSFLRLCASFASGVAGFELLNVLQKIHLGRAGLADLLFAAILIAMTVYLILRTQDKDE